MDQADKRLFWTNHLGEWSRSGLSQKAYCTQHGLKIANFRYWRKQLRPAGTTRKLIPVTPPLRSASIRMQVARLHMEVPVEALDPVLTVLRRHLREVR